MCRRCTDAVGAVSANPHASKQTLAESHIAIEDDIQELLKHGCAVLVRVEVDAPTTGPHSSQRGCVHRKARTVPHLWRPHNLLNRHFASQRHHAEIEKAAVWQSVKNSCCSTGLSGDASSHTTEARGNLSVDLLLPSCEGERVRSTAMSSSKAVGSTARTVLEVIGRLHNKQLVLWSAR